MVILRRIIDFLLYSNLWIALCAASLVMETDLLFYQKVSFHPLVWTVFFSTLLLYAAHRLIGVRIAKGFTNDNGRYLVIRKHEWHILLYAILATIGVAYFFFQLSFSQQWGVFLAALPSLAYVLPIFGNKKRIRDIHLVKIFLVALTWTFITIVLPLMKQEVISFARLFPLLMERFCFIFAITLPFDIRDLALDEFTKVKTIPSWLGIKKTKKLGYILTLLAMIFACWSFYDNIYQFRQLIAILASYIITILVIQQTTPKRHDYFFTGLVDGLMLIHFLLFYWVN